MLKIGNPYTPLGTKEERRCREQKLNLWRISVVKSGADLGREIVARHGSDRLDFAPNESNVAQ